ncbi:NADPH:quinone reductase [Roseobacter denitrificans]|uniref:Oxidoreductase, putative n=1 Tax=Roseobacter denitrificans (strain ATCC 33942 / OCh 114) TaxID=375451 RepID=Q163B3_ROSDO|nr:NADPH:quinone reductase [Roseobacter denitrificans]ABG32930.1 oxidoreductase, putative [Roseobacter denitrificans OCh 114]AVL52321.1 NADPH:quinone reductase [Roseobacter denitrificans]SFG46111.1 NADPH2:quinone reductase [Roseobacter denitrificans OCh 114]
MRAITYNRYGPADEVLALSDLPRQPPGPGEVQVELAYSAVNPSDIKRRAGARPGENKLPYDQICPHNDGSGTIVAVGEGVDPARIGDSVWIWNGQFNRALGTAAEAITLDAQQAVTLPAGVDLQTGASLGIPGLTAAHTVFGGGSIRGQSLLIHGANGTVGHLAVQLAKWGGARVIATASPAGFERCRKAGADSVVDYNAPSLAQDLLAMNDGQQYHRIIDVEFGENIETNAAIIAENGTLSVYGSAKNMTPAIPFGPLLFKAVTIDIALIYILKPDERAEATAHLLAALSAGALRCPTAEIYTLAQTARAHQAVEAGGREGAILIDVTR